MKTCNPCKTTNQKGQWWSLRNYYGLNGWFCERCFALVEHRSSWEDPIGHPVNPKGYASVLEKAKELV